MSEPAWIDLTAARARWELRGEDRMRYLNGQVTRDVRKLTPQRAELACVLDPKGRLMGDVWLSVGPDFLRIDADRALRETLGPRLERYIIADDAELLDVTDGTVQFHVLAPAENGVASQRFGVPGADLFNPTRPPGEPLVAAHVEALRIEHGIPKWGAELLPETLPAEAGLDVTAIDFAKGCYLGQEVISRIRSIGHVNKQLSCFVARDGQPLAPGLRLFADEISEREAAWITSAAWSFTLSRPLALGYLRRGTAATTLHTREPGGAPRAVDSHALPFIA